ncbi:hypothetical protein RJ55_02902 [Drechmeria coniospora]|nr:hypothetical protein RJ55_02902 [Drechmeria coniospora]
MSSAELRNTGLKLMCLEGIRHWPGTAVDAVRVRGRDADFGTDFARWHKAWRLQQLPPLACSSICINGDKCSKVRSMQRDEVKESRRSSDGSEPLFRFAFTPARRRRTGPPNVPFPATPHACSLALDPGGCITIANPSVRQPSRFIFNSVASLPPLPPCVPIHSYDPFLLLIPPVRSSRPSLRRLVLFLAFTSTRTRPRSDDGLVQRRPSSPNPPTQPFSSAAVHASRRSSCTPPLVPVRGLDGIPYDRFIRLPTRHPAPSSFRPAAPVRDVDQIASNAASSPAARPDLGTLPIVSRRACRRTWSLPADYLLPSIRTVLGPSTADPCSVSACSDAACHRRRITASNTNVVASQRRMKKPAGAGTWFMSGRTCSSRESIASATASKANSTAVVKLFFTPDPISSIRAPWTGRAFVHRSEPRTKSSPLFSCRPVHAAWAAQPKS